MNEKAKVLVVDDDKLARKGLISIMDWGKYGFEVVGEETLSNQIHCQ